MASRSIGTEFVGRHDAARGDARRIGEMFFKPGPIVTQAHSIQRGSKRGAHAVDLMARVAMVLLVNCGALRHESRRGQKRGLVLRSQRQDEERKIVEIGGWPN